MGIRSDVYITVPVDMCEDFKRMLKDTDWHKYFDEEFSSKKVKVYFAECVKWYDLYDDVNIIVGWVEERTSIGVSLLQIVENAEITGVGDNYELQTEIKVNFNA